MKEFICKYCGKECINENSLRNHERVCKENPNRQNVKNNFDDWNKKRKEQHIKSENQFTKAKRLGLEKPIISEETRSKLSKIWKGKHRTEEEKRKISITQKENYKNKCCWSTAVEHRLSYAEQYFIKIFKDYKLHYHVNRYFLDFAWPEKKIYVEVDGSQHKKDKRVVLHDIERTKILEDEGWCLIERIYWPEFSKYDDFVKKEYINKILDKIKNWGVSAQAYTLSEP